MTPSQPNSTKCPHGQAFPIFCKLLAQETDECIIWPYKTNNRYVSVDLGTGHGELIHRLAWVMTYRERIETNRIWQRCGNLSCFNPRHLEKGSRPHIQTKLETELLKLSNLDTSLCVLWPYYRMPDPRDGKPGYGCFRFRGKHTPTNRIAWIMNRGEIPRGLNVCHTCDNPGCVNLRHLFIGTQKENMQDCIRKGRKTMPCGVLNPSVKLTENQVKEMRSLYKKDSPDSSPRALAKKFSVARSTAFSIVKGKTWKHLL